MPETVSPRRRLAPGDRRQELLRACLVLIGTRSWDEVSMADVARAAGASKPLLYHYFSTKSDLYHAAVEAAAIELREATTAPPELPPSARLAHSLAAHVAWIAANADAYRAILQGGLSPDADVQAIIEESRHDVVTRLGATLGFDEVAGPAHIALRGWVGFLEGACLDWLAAPDVDDATLVRMLVTSLEVVVPTARSGGAAAKRPA